MWLENQVWPKLREAFPSLKRLPAEALITVSYPSSGARGKSEKIKPAEVNYQWTGNPNEKVFVGVHPVYFTDPVNVTKALAFGALKVTDGARWGATRAGLTKEKDGTITANPEAQAKIDDVLKDAGDMPAGFGMAFPVRTVQRHRLRKYVAKVRNCTNISSATGEFEVHPVIRAASDSLNVKCQNCGEVYIAA